MHLKILNFQTELLTTTCYYIYWPTYIIWGKEGNWQMPQNFCHLNQKLLQCMGVNFGD